MVGSITVDRVEGPGALDGELGGSATYFALAARHLGPVAVIAAVGADREVEARATLGFADLSRLTVTDEPTPVWHARRPSLGADAETLEPFGGTPGGFRPRLGGAGEWPRLVFLGSCEPAVQLAVVEGAPAGSVIGGDTMDVFIERERPQVEAVAGRLRFLILTAGELAALMRVQGLPAAAGLALERFPVEAVVAKLGPEGVALRTREGEARLPAFPVDVVDPTGAGDALAGGFMGRLAATGDLSPAGLAEALEWGVVTASFAIGAPGVEGLRRMDRSGLESRLAAYRDFSQRV